MRIGINCLYLIPGGVGGTEIYLQNLLTALAQLPGEHEYLLFADRRVPKAFFPKDERFQLWRQPISSRFRPGRLLWEQFGMATGDCEVVLNPGFTSPAFSRCPQLTWIHDLQHVQHPEHFKWLDLQAWRLMVWQSARTSSGIFTLSERSREEIVAHYGLPPERVWLAPPGVGEQFPAVAERREPGNQILCVSTLHPHKGIVTLVEAFAKFQKRHPAFRLILAGIRGFHTEKIVRRITELGLEQAVEITGWIRREELFELYRTAHTFVFPSTFEGFGMPLLEAMAAGVPAICADARPMRDIADGGALLFPAGDAEALAERLTRLVNDAGLRAELQARGKRVAAGYQWQQTAQLVLTKAIEAGLQAESSRRSSRRGTSR